MTEITPKQYTPEILAELIISHCGQYLECIGSNVLFRGIKKANEFSFSKGATNRKPVHIPTFIHEKLDTALKRNGFHSLRSNSIFASSDIDQADIYGDLQVIFPIGDFSFLWSPVIRDLLDVDDFLGKAEPDEIDDFVLNNYKQNDMDAAVKAENEILINCEDYYMIEAAYFMDDVLPLLQRLRNLPPVKVRDEVWRKLFPRVGFIPYQVIENQISMMFMKPSNPEFGGDKPQIAKGVFRHNEEAADKAALREAHEELGLKKSNLTDYFLADENDLFNVYAGQIKNIDDFDVPHYETSETYWMTLDQFEKQGRELHYTIVKAVNEAIEKSIFVT